MGYITRSIARDIRRTAGGRAAAKRAGVPGRPVSAGAVTGGILFGLIVLGGLGSLAAKVPGSAWIALALGSAGVAAVIWLVAVANRRYG
jgi:hypothetical protein